MRTHAKLVLAGVIAGALLANPALAGPWQVPNDGFLIQLSTPNGIAQKSGQTAQINGTITWVGGHIPPGHSGWGDHGHDNDALTDLLQSDGLQIKAYFPDATTDVTSQLRLTPSRNGITVQFTTPALQTQVPSALTLIVSHQDPMVLALQKVEAKLNVRIAALQAVIAKLSAQGDSARDLSWLQNDVTELQALSARIQAKILAGNEVLAQQVFPLQVDNIVASGSMNSSLIEPFRFTVSYDIGSAIEGESTTAHGIIARDSDDQDPNGQGSGYWTPRFFWNGNQVQQMSSQKIGSGSQVEFDYPVSELDPSQQNTFAESLTRSDHDDGGHWDWDDWWNQHDFWNNQSGGMLAYGLPVSVDNVAPTWLAGGTPSKNVCMNAMQPINMTAFDTFGLVDPDSVQATLTGTQTDGTAVNQDVIQQITASTPDQGQTYDFTGNLNPIADGLYNFSIASTDLAGNATTPNPSTAQFRVDTVPPTVTLGPLAQIYTNAPYTNIANLAFTATTVDYYDLCSITTTATDGSTVLGSSTTGNLSVSTHLQDGVHEIQVSAVNSSDGLTSTAQSFPLIVDTVPPVLSNVSPAPNSTINTLTFAVSGSANEPLLYAKVNGQSLTLSADQKSFIGSYTVQVSGALTLHYEVADLATNITTQDVPVQVVLGVLNKNLISVVPDKTNSNEVEIIGSAGAAAPGQTVTFSSGLFGSESTIASADGSFEIVAPIFTSGTISVNDTAISMSGSATLNYGSSSGTLLSGAVKDTSGNPLPGVTVSILGLSTVAPVVTDANGVYSFQQPATGDQVLSFDGTTVPSSVTNGTEQFSVVRVSINVGLNQSNVLSPVYLAPVNLATATQIPTSGPIEVTDANAPGSTLSFDASTATFPGAVHAISMTRIAAANATISPLAFDMPGHVVALEPSGLSFSSPAQLTLPNDNDLPPGTDTLIMSMDSQKGIWEIDGAATVSSDGQSIVTKPGMGITHFSLVYATPLGPQVSQIGSQDQPGADAFNGALTTQVALPSYKALGSRITPALIYKSVWANPTALVTNLFNIPQTQITVNNIVGGLYQGFLYTAVINGTGTIQPDYVTAQFFTNGIASNIMTFNDVPSNAALSYATQLQDPATGQYFPSGVYPYESHYEIHLKDLIVGTETTSVLVGARTSAVVSQTGFTQTVPIQQAFPSDLTGPIYVQNKVGSAAGRGWKIAGAERILNPSGNRILLEEEDGSIAAYSLNNTISTLADGSSLGFDLTLGSDLSSWPNAKVTVNDPTSTVENTPPLRSLASIDLSQNTPSLSNLGSISQSAGYFALPPAGTSPTPPCAPQHVFKLYIAADPVQFVTAQDGTIYGTNVSSLGQPLNFTVSGVFSLGQNQVKTLSLITDEPVHYLLAGNDNIFFNSQPYGDGFTYFNYDNYGYSVTDAGYASYPAVNGYCTNVSEQSIDNYPVYGPIPGVFRDFIHLMGITIGPSGQIVVADSGNNVVSEFNLSAFSDATPPREYASVIAGNFHNFDNGDGGPATAASMFHPQGLAYDSQGNLYISTANGYIRKVDVTGTISTFAGLPASLGGVLANNAPANKMVLNNPFGMVVDNVNGYLYVADTGNNRVLRIDFLTKTAVTVAGNGQAGFNGDNQPALSASLSAPTLLGLDDQQNLIIADSGNNKIRRVVFQSDSTGALSYAPVSHDNSTLARNADGTWTRSYRNGTVVSFDSSGNESSSTDRVGRTTNFSYDSGGRLEAVTDPTGQVIQYSYSGSNLSSIVDPAGRATNFSYDGNNDLVAVSFPDGTRRAFAYDANGMIVSETDQRGMVTQYKYNQWNRLASVVRADNSTVTVNDSGSATALNNYTGGTIGQAQSYGNGNGQASDTITDARSIQTSFVKDTSGYITKIVDASGGVTQIARNQYGNPTQVTRPDSTTLTFVYDPTTQDLLSQSDSASGITTSQSYDSFGEVLTKTNGRGYTSTNTYQANGLMSSSADPLGHGTTYTYNSLGLPVTVQNSEGVATTTTFDSHGNATAVTDSADHVTKYTYDSAGNVLTVTDPNGDTTAYTYDPFNRVTSVTTPKKETTQYTYLPTGQLAMIEDPLGNQTTFQYNSLGQMVQRTDPLGFSLKLSYDGNGNVIQAIDPNGNTKVYSYDNLNRLIKKQLPDNLVAVSYDASGNVTQIVNNQTELDMSYTDASQVASVTSRGLGSYSNIPAVTLSYEYDGDNNRTSMSGPEGTTNYTYDSADRLTSVANPLGQSYSFGYDAANRITSIDRPGSQTQYTFDAASFISSIEHSSVSGIFASYSYHRDAIGDVTGITTSVASRTLAYDQDNQLTAATNPESPLAALQAESFSYDSIANRTADEGGTYNYDSKSQRLIRDYRYTYIYDNNGNLSSKQEVGTGVGTDGIVGEVTNYFYSSENQLLGFKVYPAGSTTPSKTVTYVYDGLGRRVQKTVYDATAASDPSKTFTRNYAYDADNVLLEYDGDNNLLAQYTHSTLGPDDVLAVNVTSSGVSAKVAQNTGSFVYLKDEEGTVTDVADTNGNKIQHYVYSAFGELLGIQDAQANDITSNPVLNTTYGFTGRERDPESGLMYYRARYYDPASGRFLQRDPSPGSLAIPTSVVNGYSYAAHNPFGITDPSGRSWLEDVAIGLGAAAFALTGVGLIVGGASLAAALMGATTAVLSVAGGALAMAAIQSAVLHQWGATFWTNFEVNFSIGAAGLAIGSFASLFKGGLVAAGGNGLNGYAVSRNEVLTGDSYTIGSGTILNASPGDISHEFGHTVFALAFAAGGTYAAKSAGLSGPVAGGIGLWSIFFATAAPGAFWNAGYQSGFESWVTSVGGATYYEGPSADMFGSSWGVASDQYPSSYY